MTTPRQTPTPRFGLTTTTPSDAVALFGASRFLSSASILLRIPKITTRAFSVDYALRGEGYPNFYPLFFQLFPHSVIAPSFFPAPYSPLATRHQPLPLDLLSFQWDVQVLFGQLPHFQSLAQYRGGGGGVPCSKARLRHLSPPVPHSPPKPRSGEERVVCVSTWVSGIPTRSGLANSPKLPAIVLT